MPSIGPLELAIIAVILLLLFGAKRLPQLGRTLGAGMREFKEPLTIEKKPQRSEPTDTQRRSGSDNGT
jgi:TatA/E family protein of Tat protein translocase